MGNRAVITTKDKKIGVYLHWNGGRDSVEAFLRYCELQRFRYPEEDCYGWARLCQIIANFFTEPDDYSKGLSIGIDQYSKLDTDNYDNGVYIIEKWKIIDRLYNRNSEQNTYDLKEMLKIIDTHQPESMQLFKNIEAEDIKLNQEEE